MHEPTEATSAVMVRTTNALGAILRRPVTIDSVVGWEGDGLRMSFDLERAADYSQVAAIQQLQALAEIDGTDAKIRAIIDVVVSLILDARDVPGFDARGADESLDAFRARFSTYFSEAGADVLLLGVFTEYAEKDMVPLAERKANFRP